MKRSMILSGILGLGLCVVGHGGFADAKEPVVGGSSATEVTKSEVVAAANFAIREQQAVMKKNQETATAKLTMVSIVSAEEQVVAGMNYKLKLKVTLEGKEKMAEAVVWWQAWNKETPYRLTSWNWL